MRACEKKKKYREMCRNQVKNGLINDAEGKWIKYDSNKAMHRDMVAGYKIR